MKASVIVTTYNQPAWLKKCLLGFACQDRNDFEVIVADDGSAESTSELIHQIKQQLPFSLQHVWQKDDGFRKCRIMNKALLKASSDYVIFTDGDCIPRSDFVSTHLQLRSPNTYLSGGYFKLPMGISLAISDEEIAKQHCFDLSWLYSKGLKLQARNLKLHARGFSALLADKLIPTRASWNGHNSSVWLQNLLAAKGFDERMGYGGEDRELGERLVHAGLTGMRVRHRAIVVHLDHERGYVNEKHRVINNQIRTETRKEKSCQTKFGLNLHEK